jgi:hypothetical protein
MREIFPIVGLAVTIAIAGVMTVKLRAQAVAEVSFSSAMTAEVVDAQGQTLLRGQFGAPARDEDDKEEMERLARLEPAGADTDAAGEAELELSGTAGTAAREVEFTARHVQPGAVFTLTIDGRTLGTARANAQGEIDFERHLPAAGAAGQ